MFRKFIIREDYEEKAAKRIMNFLLQNVPAEERVESYIQQDMDYICRAYSGAIYVSNEVASTGYSRFYFYETYQVLGTRHHEVPVLYPRKTNFKQNLEEKDKQ